MFNTEMVLMAFELKMRMSMNKFNKNPLNIDQEFP